MLLRVFMLVQAYTVKPEKYSFGVLLSPLQADEGPQNKAAELWLQHSKA